VHRYRRRRGCAIANFGKYRLGRLKNAATLAGGHPMNSSALFPWEQQQHTGKPIVR
jgi:hypothetical protein